MSDFNGDIERAAHSDPYARARVDQRNLERSFKSHYHSTGSRAASGGGLGGLAKLLLASFVLYLVAYNFPNLFGDANTGEVMLFLFAGLIVLIVLIRFAKLFLMIGDAVQRQHEH